MVEWRVIYALNRSRVKREILELMSRYPGRIFSLSEIAKYTDNYITTVYGALHGLKGHYRDDLSLISLGLVQFIQYDKGARGYRITDLGVNVISYLIKHSALQEKYQV